MNAHELQRDVPHLENESVQARKLQYEHSLKEALKEGYKPLSNDVEDEEASNITKKESDTPTHDPYEPYLEDDPKDKQLLEADDLSHEYYDRYVGARARLPQADKAPYGEVIEIFT